MKETTSVPINLESSGYSVLKNLNATILGVHVNLLIILYRYENKKEEIKKYEMIINLR